jgi:predicted metal-dependent peptidase
LAKGLKNRRASDADMELADLVSREAEPLSDAQLDQVDELIAFARFKIMRSPKTAYLYNAVANMRPVYSMTLKAVMGVDRWWRCYIRPDALLRMDENTIAGVLLHEAYHLILNHHYRATQVGVTEMTHMLANISEDMCINETVDFSGFALPGWVVRTEDFNRKTGENWELHYHWLLEHYPTIDIGGLLGAGYIIGYGSGSDGSQHEHEQPGLDEGNGDTDNRTNTPVAGVDEFFAETIRNQIAEDIRSGRHAGNVPNGMLVWADEQLKPPKVSWRKELPYVIRSALSKSIDDYSYLKRHAHQQMFGRLVLPGNIGFEPVIGINMDTSGSMCDGFSFKAAVSEIAGLLKSFDKVFLISNDCDVHASAEITNAKQVKLYGGGGTDMGRGLEFFKTFKPQVDVVITITDGYTGWPAENTYKFSHITVLTQKGGSRPDFGKCVLITED